MDIYCRRCGEPWDIDTLHEEAAESGRTFQEVRADFARRGCQALAAFTGNDQPCEKQETARGAASGALMDILGDDIDGVASLLDDEGF
jgi:hypothetical protein